MNMQPVPAVVLPVDRPASLGIARSLGRRGIPVYGVDADPHAIGMPSRFITPRPFPSAATSDADRIQFLVELGKRLGQRAVLYPVSDDTVMLCSQHRDELQQYFTYVMPDHDTISSLLTKDGLHRMAEQHHIPDPCMFQVGSQADIERLRGVLPFPVILKPVFSPSWLRPEIITMLRDGALSGPPKVALCRSFEELSDTYRKLSAYDSRMIVQEVIPGEDRRLVYFCFYLDRQSNPLATFAGEKLRVLPVGFGSASYVRSFHDPDLEQVSLRLLREAHYQGLGGVEFKKDPRDECYKLIEFNARLGMWDCLGMRCGVDIPYVAYRDALGLPVEPQRGYRAGVLWIDFQRDVRAFLIYRQRGQLTLVQWLRSLAGEKDWAIYSGDDWKPALLAFFELFRRPMDLLRAKWERLRGTLTGKQGR